MAENDTGIEDIKEELKRLNSGGVLSYQIENLTKSIDKLVEVSDQSSRAILMLPVDFSAKLDTIVNSQHKFSEKMFFNLERILEVSEDNQADLMDNLKKQLQNSIIDSQESVVGEIKSQVNFRRDVIDFLKMFAAIIAAIVTIWGFSKDFLNRHPEVLSSHPQQTQSTTKK